MNVVIYMLGDWIHLTHQNTARTVGSKHKFSLFSVGPFESAKYHVVSRPKPQLQVIFLSVVCLGSSGEQKSVACDSSHKDMRYGRVLGLGGFHLIVPRALLVDR